MMRGDAAIHESCIWEKAAALLGWRQTGDYGGYINDQFQGSISVMRSYNQSATDYSFGHYKVCKTADMACYYSGLETLEEAARYVAGKANT